MSFDSLASSLGFLGARPVSKQAVAQRFSPCCADFVRHALFSVMGSVARVSDARNSGAFAAFKRVLVQDSTSLALHPRLANAFPGARNQSAAKQAGAKIQAIYDLLSETFVFFQLTAFTRNDQAASPDILEVARSGDLILRDLGYFVLDVFEEMEERSIHFLSRLRPKISLFDGNGNQIELLSELRKFGRMDQWVWMGTQKMVRVRLVATPLPQAVADSRRRKAKANRDKRCKPNKEQLALLGWEIYITNVDGEIWSPDDICRIYGLRWRIEIIFKSWKSHFRAGDLPAGSATQVKTVIYARLLAICIFHTFFDPLATIMSSKYGKALSILKLARFLTENVWSLVDLVRNKGGEELLENLIQIHCCHDKRKKRSSYREEMESLS